MPLVVFKRARDVGVLEDIEHPIIRENVKAHELVVGRDVEVHEGKVQLALRPSGICEVGVDN